MKQKILDFWNKEWTLEEKALFGIGAVLTGTVIGLVTGFIISPAKQGFSVLSHNGSGNGSNNSDCKALGVDPNKGKGSKNEKKEDTAKECKRLEKKPLRGRLHIHSLQKER